MAHQIFIGITKNIITACLVLFEIEFVTLENGNQAGELIHHFLAAAQLGLVIEMGIIDYAAKIVLAGFCQLGDDLVHFFADIFITLQCNQIIEAAAIGDRNVGVFYTLELVCNILHE